MARLPLTKLATITLLALLSLSVSAPPTQEIRFGLPFDQPPGPSTWLFGQPYGNTVFAYRTRIIQYGAGQGLHFGLDFPAHCGTTVVSIGDGVVDKVDALSHGAGPHNLMIRHEGNLISLYGHLLERPNLEVGQPVTRGQPIALTGDPDVTCSSRPHLHLEIRSGDYTYAYNPILYIDADWETLALASPFGTSFSRDVNNPRQWQALDDQPETHFGYEILNEYAQPWPPEWNGQ
jgi:murein DD-endopeptidase MepM/ murein hydrolase activator NlpD